MSELQGNKKILSSWRGMTWKEARKTGWTDEN